MDAIQNLDAERTVLGAILAEGRGPLAAAAQFLEPRHFSDKRNGKVFEAALAIFERGDSVDFVTVKAELGTAVDVGFLSALVEGVPRITNMADWVEIVLDRARRRAAHNLGKRLMEHALDDSVLTSEMLDRHQSALSQLIEVTSAGSLLSQRDVIKQATELAGF
jgi:replicative DNA helicase